MRVFSTSPAAAEWLGALGAEVALIGSEREGELRRTDAGVDRLRETWPDLIVVGEETPGEAGYDLPGRGVQPEVVVFAPQTFKQMLDAVLGLGRRIGRAAEAMALLAAAERRLAELHARIGLQKRTDPERLPSVVVLSSPVPLVVSGGWMPQLVELAGGRRVELATGGDADAWASLCAADPDVVCLVPGEPGVGDAALRAFAARDGSNELSAVRGGRVYAFDDAHAFDRPGPRLYRAVELLAATLYPEPLAGLEPPIESWERRALSEVAGLHVPNWS